MNDSNIVFEFYYYILSRGNEEKRLRAFFLTKKNYI